jgi:hypothetical protein
MNRMFDLKMMVKAMLIVTLSLAIVFTSGCRRKQQDKSVKTPPARVSNKQKSPVKNTAPKTPAVKASDQNVQIVEASNQNVQNIEANDQNVVALPDAAKKETVTVPDTNTKETVTAVPQEEAEVVVEVSEEPMTTEQPSPVQLEEMTSSEPLDLNSFGGTKSTRKKLDFIPKFASDSPGSLPELVDIALDDKDPGVRATAMDEITKKGFYSSEIIPVVEKAMGDPEPAIRQKAIEACAHITDPEVGDILKMALEDEREDVRAAAISISAQKDPAIRLPILEAGITSQHTDVKAGAVTELMTTSSPAAFDILITALNDPDPEFHYTVKSTINFLVSQEFETYDQAKQWWDTNRQNFSENLKPKN